MTRSSAQPRVAEIADKLKGGELTIPGVPDELQHANKELGDKTLPQPPAALASGELEETLPIEVDGVTFSIQGVAGVYAFNSLDDKDPDGILAPAPAADDDDELALGSQIDLDPQHAWLKYEAGVTGKASTSLKDEGFEFNFNAEGGARLTSYQRHDRSEKVGTAVVQDLSDPRLALSASHVRGLEAGEAVGLHVHGKLQAGLKLKWGDVLASGMGTLSRLLDQGEVFNIRVDAALAVSFDVAIEDGFVVVFSRVDENHLRVALRKADGKTLQAGLVAKIGAQFSDPKAVETVLGNVLDGLLGEPFAKVKEILGQATFEGLDDTEKAIVERLLERLGLDSAVADLAALRKKVADLKKETKAKLKEIAETKAELSFSYEYRRVSSDTAVLQATLPVSAINDYHGALIRGRYRGFLTDAAAKPDLALERFLHEQSLEVRKAWGFSLSFGRWFKASGRDHIEIKQVVRRNAQDHQQITFLGSRGYTGKWKEDSFLWDVDFNAEMPGFSAQLMPTANELDYSLYLLMEYGEGDLSGVELAEMIDHAVIWGGIPAARALSERARLAVLLDGREGVTFSFQLKFDSDAFEGVLDDLAAGDAARFGDALGEAMPWGSDFPKVQQVPRERRKLYGALWTRYLQDRSLRPSELAGLARQTFKKQGHETLGWQEGETWRTQRTTTIAGLADLNSRTRRQWEQLSQGAKLLGKAIDRQQPYEKVKKVYRRMRRLWTQSHHVRALGVYLLDLLREHPELEEGVERVFTVTFTGDDGKEQIENISCAGMD